MVIQSRNGGTHVDRCEVKKVALEALQRRLGESRTGTSQAIKALVMLAFGLVAAGAEAQEAGPAKPVQYSEEHFRQGNDYIRGGNLEGAEQSYEKAFALKQTHDIAANLGYAELQLKKYREAAEHLSLALGRWPPSGNAENRKYAQQWLNEARANVGVLRVVVSKPGAKVSVDGKEVGTSPLDGPVFVDPGEHVVEATLPGFEGQPVKVQAAAGSDQEVRLPLSEKPAAISPAVAAGTGDERASQGRLPALIAGAAVTAGGLVVGIGFNVAANNKIDKALEHTARAGGSTACYGSPPPPRTGECKAADDAARAGATFTDVAIAGYVIGGVAALATATTFFVWPKPKAEKRSMEVRVSPRTSLQSVGLDVTGSF